MTVEPGFCGQAFISSQLEKISMIHKRISLCQRPIELQVDGGMTPETSALCIEHGANVVVAGTAVFKTDNYRQNIECLRGVRHSSAGARS